MKNFWKNKKVVITGAAGFIGSYAVQRLVENGADVTAIVSVRTDNKRIADMLGHSIEKIRIRKANLLEINSCKDIAKGQDMLLNFAAMDGGASFKNKYPALILRTNSQITLNILEASRLQNLQGLLLMSSVVVYSTHAKSPLREDADIGELSTGAVDGYVGSKKFLEIAARTYAREYNLPIGLVRAGNIYGPRDYIAGEKSRVIVSFIKNALEGNDITIWGKGDVKKQFIYVTDFIDAALTLMERKTDCDPINIASQREIALKELAALVIQQVGGRSKIKFEPIANQSNSQTISVAKAKETIHFHEKITLEKGIAETIAYVKRNL